MPDTSPAPPTDPRHPRLRGALRSRPLHFLALGAAIFALSHASTLVAQARIPASEPVEIGSEVVLRLSESFRAQMGREPTRPELERLLEPEIEDELLFREARRRGLGSLDRSVRTRLVQKIRFLGAPGLEEASDEELHAEALRLGLDRDDLVIRRFLVQKMRFLAGAEASRTEASDAELADFLARHAERFAREPRLTLTHAYLRGAEGELEDRALRWRAALDGGDESPARAARRGDPFAGGHTLRGKTPSRLAKLLGPTFAEAAASCPLRSWCGPLRSPYGIHFVWVEERSEGGVAPLAEVRTQVAKALEHERRERHVAEFVRALRARQPVAVAWPS